ncbi:MAG: hypothetical protein ACO1RX_07105 [Candidatus Sericytochromatia bacterium]
MAILWENIFVAGVMLMSGGYIVQRLQRMSQAHKRRESACGSCSSGTCGGTSVQATPGETSLPLR